MMLLTWSDLCWLKNRRIAETTFLETPGAHPSSVVAAYFHESFSKCSEASGLLHLAICHILLLLCSN